MSKKLTAKQLKRIKRLHEARDHECDKALNAIENGNYIQYLSYDASARAIGRRIHELLDGWLGS